MRNHPDNLICFALLTNRRPKNKYLFSKSKANTNVRGLFSMEPLPFFVIRFRFQSADHCMMTIAHTHEDISITQWL